MPKYTPDPEKQPELLHEERAAYQLSPEEQKEKEGYRQRLRAYLRDPDFRQIQGFPIGEDEDILALSDPPFYTTCPNPFLGEIIAEWQQERAVLRKELNLPDDSQDNGNGLKVYHREPYASDVSEGKNDPIYNAHSYHTKVPHKAVMRYILHYTDPGDIVLDGFCGTGMTGVAAQLCGDKKTVESLGYTAKRDGTVLDEKGEVISKLGARKAVLVDLSPAATFIAYNYNTPVDTLAFEKEARRILKEVKKECSWMYETWHPHSDDPNRVKCTIKYTVWSDVFVCPNCSEEMVYWNMVVDQENRKVLDVWDCSSCGTQLAKNPRKKSRAIRVDRAYESLFDRTLGKTISRAKQVPVMINYSVGSKRFKKAPDSYDLMVVKKIEDSELPYTFPTTRMPVGDESRRNDDIGITHVFHYYTRRNLWILASINTKIGELRGKTSERIINLLRIWFTSSHSRLHKLNRYMAQHNRHVGPLSGTLYISSTPVEISPFYFAEVKIKDFISLKSIRKFELVSTQSSTNIGSDSSSVDYVFVDPPFGGNIWYSELNFLWESWLKLYTNNNEEAVVSKTQRKAMPEYQNLMENCFREFYRLLKPGRWMTIEFHKSQNSVWNAIQEGI